MLVILLIAPLATFAQQRVPNFPTDSLSGLIQYRLKLDFAGDDKKKIFNVMMKWFDTNGSRGDLGILNADAGRDTLTATLEVSMPPDRSTEFELKMSVTDGSAIITISNFRVSDGMGMEPLESYRDRVKQEDPNSMAKSALIPATLTRDKQFVSSLNKSLAEYDSNVLDNIDQNASDMLRNAKKFVKKAKKQGLI